MRMTTTVDNMFFPLQWTDILSSSQFFSDRVPAGEAANELVLQWAVFTDGLQRYSTLAAELMLTSLKSFVKKRHGC